MYNWYVWVRFIIFFTKNYILGPEITVTVNKSISHVVPSVNGSDHNIPAGPFIIETPALSSYSQQLWVIARIKTENTDGEYGYPNFNHSTLY